MTVKIIPHYSYNNIFLVVDVELENIIENDEFISLKSVLTQPNNTRIKVADNDVHLITGNKVKCQYFVNISPLISGKYILTSNASKDGHFLDINREVFYINVIDDSSYIIRNPKLCWRKENGNMISVFEANGNIVFLKGRLKTIWENATGKHTVSDLSASLNLSKEECYELIKRLEDKKLIVERKKTEVLIKGELHEFN